MPIPLCTYDHDVTSQVANRKFYLPYLGNQPMCNIIYGKFHYTALCNLPVPDKKFLQTPSLGHYCQFWFGQSDTVETGRRLVKPVWFDPQSTTDQVISQVWPHSILQASTWSWRAEAIDVWINIESQHTVCDLHFASQAELVEHRDLAGLNSPVLQEGNYSRLECGEISAGPNTTKNAGKYRDRYLEFRDF